MTHLERNFRNGKCDVVRGHAVPPVDLFLLNIGQVGWEGHYRGHHCAKHDEQQGEKAKANEKNEQKTLVTV